jgi:hypothetical protein
MTRYRYYTATTVDGFLADESDSLAWLFKQDTGGGGAVDLSLRSFSRAGDFLTATFDVVGPLGTR